ncbi:hypothetical protein Mar181_2150 [Marinomonas posidonica IVIA-Po-181]|uniref:Uncharacterized protein n=2 Tax=Marinomonas TaxID=28253 RepID=F6CU69_MARPP|nr:hypothetical protein Mar181_2150 [Marinomonas posidonica IVIA-Po-181]
MNLSVYSVWWLSQSQFGSHALNQKTLQRTQQAKIKNETMWSVKWKLISAVVVVVLPTHAFGNPLIEFGKGCLIEEQHLNQIAIQANQRQQNLQQAQQASKTLKQQVNLYEERQNKLDTSIEECQQAEKNTPYCHNIRDQHQQLSQLIRETNQALIDEEETLSLYSYELIRDDYEQKRARFQMRCRSSNQHYAFIQNPEAYSAVCHSEMLKQTLTCTF